MDFLEKTCLFFAGIYTHFHKLDCDKLWPDKNCELWHRYTTIMKNELKFYQTLNDQEKEQLINWYNSKMSEFQPKNNKSGQSTITVNLTDITQSVPFLIYVTQNIEQLCVEIWNQYSSHYINRWNIYNGRVWFFYRILDGPNKIKLYVAYIRHTRTIL